MTTGFTNKEPLMQTNSIGPPAVRAVPPPPHASTPGADLVEQLLSDDDWWLQPMLAGRPVRLRRRGADVVAVDAAGQLFRPPRTIAEAVLTAVSASFVIGGATVGEGGGGEDAIVVLHEIDMLECV